MSERGTSSLHRLLAVALLVTVAWSAFHGVLMPLARMYKGYDSVLADGTFRLDKYRRLASGRAEIEQQLKAHELTASDSALYLKGSTDALAAAALQEYLQALVQSTGGTLISTNPLPVKNTSELTLVTVNARMAVESSSLAKFLYMIETAKPIAFIDKLHIQAGGWSPYSLNIRSGTVLFTVEMNVSAYARNLKAKGS